MVDFNKAQSFVKLAEGGYTDNPTDNGNWTGGKVGVGVLIGTNHGISAPVLSAYLGRTATVSDMKNLSYETAVQIYKRNYWDNLSLGNLKNQSVALLMYDSGVNLGTGWLKGAVADSLKTINITASSRERWQALVDKINQADQKRFYDSLWNIRKKKYDALRSRKPQFYDGWMNRLNRLGFFLTETVKKNKKPILITALVVTTVLVGLIVYRKKIIKKLD